MSIVLLTLDRRRTAWEESRRTSKASRRWVTASSRDTAASIMAVERVQPNTKDGAGLPAAGCRALKLSQVLTQKNQGGRLIGVAGTTWRALSLALLLRLPPLCR